MKTKNIMSSFLILVIFLVSSSCIAANTSSCVTCHTNEAIMKSLYKAPVLPPSEGEG